MAIWVVEEYDIVVFSFWQRMRRDSNLSKCKAPVEPCSLRAGPQRHHNVIDFLLWYPKFPVRIGSRNFDHCHSFHSLFPPPAAVVSLPLILCHEVRVCRRCGAGMGDCAATIPPSAHSGRHLPLHKGGFGALPRRREALGAEEGRTVAGDQ